MMTVQELLVELQAKDIKFWIDGGKLRYRAPRGALTDDIRSRLTELKPEIIALLAGRAGNPPSATSARGGAMPLSRPEEGLWLLDRVHPGQSAWNMQSAVRLRGALDIAALQRSFNRLVARHQVLHTSFAVRDGHPVRVIAPALEAELPVIRIDAPRDRVDGEIRRIAAADEKQPFDLARLPLWRVKLLRIDEREHVFVYTVHHIISDSSSSRIFYRELFEMYEADAAGVRAALPPLPTQYADYAVARRERESAELALHLPYWKQRLQNTVIPEVPSDMRRIEQRSYRGAKERLALGAELTRNLRALCKQERITMFMLLLAAFKILLRRYTGGDNIIVGAATAGRTRPELEHLIGMFINLLPLRTDLGGQPTFRELLRRVREVCLQAYEHQDLPFERIVAEINPGRLPTRNPFFQVLFDVVELPPNRLAFGDLTLEPLARVEDTARYEIVIRAPQTAAGLEIWIDYSTDLFSPARIEEMLSQYKYLLEQAVHDPDGKIDGYSIRTVSARDALPDPAAALDSSWRGPVHDFLERHATEQPAKVAVADPDESWTYGDLNRRANQMARHLRAGGIGRNDIVAVYGERGASLVLAIMGIFKAGAGYFIVDPSHPLERRKHYLAEVRPKALIALSSASSDLPEIQAMAEALAEQCVIQLLARGDDSLSGYSTDDLGVEIRADDLASVIFTSGSTGKPKGVLGRHSSLTHFLPWIERTFEISAQDRFSALAGVSSNILQREMFTALSLGATLLMPGSSAAARAAKLDAWLREHEVTVVHLTPALGHVIAQTATATIPGVRRVFFAGDLLTLDDVAKTRNLMPQAEIVNFYASSESQRASGYEVLSAEPDAHAKSVPPLGRGVQDVQLLVVNDCSEVAGVGELGEIWVRSPHLALGYLNDDRLTAEKFPVNPFTGKTGDRVYRTGERGRFLPNGEVEFAGRSEHAISIRGFRVDINEIECALARHAAVLSAVVVARQDETQETRLVGYVVPKREPAPSATALRSFLTQSLPDHMLPSAFVFLSGLPLTSNGKVDRDALPPVRQIRPELQNTYVAARTPLEKFLADICSEILHVKPVGARDNFFDLGGHSMLAVRLVAEVERRGMKDVPVALPFEAPTIALMSKVLSQAQRKLSSSLLPIQAGGTRPPFFCIDGSAGYIPVSRCLDADQPFYGLVVDIDGKSRRFRTIEEMAVYYIGEMKKIQSRGPYFLGGHAAGGVIALEGARQLRKEGERVAFLALIDPVAGETAPAGAKLLEAARHWYRGLRAAAKPMAAGSVEGDSTGNIDPAFSPRIPSSCEDAFRNRGLYRRLLRGYEPAPYDGKLAFFWPAEKSASGGRWNALMERAEVYRLPGDHLLADPGVSILAQQLQTCLTMAQSALRL